MSERIYLGQVNKSADKLNSGIDKDIINGLTFNNFRILENIINENKTKIRLRNINEFCHPVSNVNFNTAIKSTGIV